MPGSQEPWQAHSIVGFCGAAYQRSVLYLSMSACQIYNLRASVLPCASDLRDMGLWGAAAGAVGGGRWLSWPRAGALTTPTRPMLGTPPTEHPTQL